MLYFAYGSNTFQKQMAERCPRATFLCSDTLKGYTLTFNKKGIDNTGKANIVVDPSGLVHGVIYKINEEEVRQLDVYEGLGFHYIKKIVVTTSGYRCFVYIAVPERCDSNLNPSKVYKKKVLMGLREIKAPRDYIKKIERLRISEPHYVSFKDDETASFQEPYRISSDEIDLFLAQHPEFLK